MTVSTTSSVVSAALQSRTIQEYLAHCMTLTDNVLAFPHTSADLTYFTPQQIGQMAHQAASLYRKRGLSHRDGAGPSVVGLRAQSTLEWVVSFVALLRLGHTALILAPTLSIEAASSLMSKSHCDCLVDGTSDRSGLEGLGRIIIPLATVDEVSGQRLSGHSDEEDYSRYWFELSEDDAAFIVHSSGTTGLPKLIPKSHRQLLMGLKTVPAEYQNKSFFVGSSFYYIVGIFSVLMSFMKTRPTVYANEKLPLVPDGYRQLLVEARPEVAYFSPFNLIIAASTQESIDVLKGCLMVTVIGAVCPQQLGDRLVKAGVRLANEYGMTELSWGMTSASRPPGDLDWEYVAPNQFTKPHVELRPLPEEDGSTLAGGEQLYELIILPSHPLQDKRWANSDDGSYHTGDMFVKHPTAERWKPVGRKDDVIKTFPDDSMVPLNAILYENKIKAATENIVDEVVLFGHERRHPGVLIFTKPGSAASPDTVLEHVWATIEREINGVLKVGLMRHMLKVVQGATVPRTPKGSFIRPEVYLKFEHVIQSAYPDWSSQREQARDCGKSISYFPCNLIK